MSVNTSQSDFHTRHALALWTASRNSSGIFKFIAQEAYYRHTFSIMLEIDTREGHHICRPIIIADGEDLDSLKRSIQRMFTIEDQISVTVVWEGSGIHFATVEDDKKLVNETTFATLRLLKQRGGVDKLLVKEVGAD